VNLASMIATNPKRRVAKKFLGGQMTHLTKMNPYLNSDNHLIHKLEMWANAQPDGRPAEYRWRPLSNAAVWLMPTT